MNFTREDKRMIKEEVFRLLDQQLPKEKSQDIEYLENELAKLFIADEEAYPGAWLFDKFQSLDEKTGVGYFVFITAHGFIPGLQVKQDQEVRVQAWPALFSIMNPEGVLKKIQSAYYKSLFIANSEEMNRFYNRLVQIIRPGKIPQTFTFDQQKNLYEEVLYSRDLAELSDVEQLRLHELLHTKPVSQYFFEVIENQRKFLSDNYWEIYAVRKRWMKEKNLKDQQLQFVQLKKDKLYYGIYSR